MRKETSRSIQRTEGKDYKSIYTHSSKKKRKILSRNRYFRVYHRRNLKNKKENGGLLHFCQGQCSQLKEIMRFTTKNYLQ